MAVLPNPEVGIVVVGELPDGGAVIPKLAIVGDEDVLGGVTGAGVGA
jgi:hypothetical protein